MAAFLSANIMNVWTKRKVKPGQLLRRRRSTVNVANFKNSDELEAYLARKREEMN